MQRTSTDQMVLVGFLQAQNCSILTSSWRNPESSTDFLSANYYQEIAKALERANFHLAFFDDRLAMPDTYGTSHEATVRDGIRPVKLDPIPILAVMAGATRHLGLGATMSTTYFEPYHVARLFQTLDHLTGGRAAWNVVTSLNNSEAANFGRDKHLDHDMRYDRADEFVDAVIGHWRSWDDDALVIDRERGIFGDPDKVHRLDYEGKFVRTRGPFTVPRSPQGHPVIIQAGQSSRGNIFAARTAEVIFASYRNLDVAKKSYARVKQLVSESGRNPDQVKITPSIYVVVGETKSEAEDRIARIDSLNRPLDGIVLLSEQIAFDFSTKELDEPCSDAELESINGVRAVRDRIVEASGKRNPTVRDFLEFSAKSTLRELPLIYGSPEEIADQMEEWFKAPACDGFVIPATHIPGTYLEFAEKVSPELQRRGLLQKGYVGATLRHNLGLPRP